MATAGQDSPRLAMIVTYLPVFDSTASRIFQEFDLESWKTVSSSPLMTANHLYRSDGCFVCTRPLPCERPCGPGTRREPVLCSAGPHRRGSKTSTSAKTRDACRTHWNAWEARAAEIGAEARAAIVGCGGARREGGSRARRSGQGAGTRPCTGYRPVKPMTIPGHLTPEAHRHRPATMCWTAIRDCGEGTHDQTIGLSKQLPWAPMDCRTPAGSQRRVNASAVYWLPRLDTGPGRP